MALSFPANPSNGDRTTLNDRTYSYNSTTGSWTTVPTGATRAKVFQSDNSPSNPATGDLWYDTTELKLYTYYTDDSSNSHWVSTEPSGTVGSALDSADVLSITGGGGGGVTTYDSSGALPSSGASTGDFGFTTNTKSLYLYDGSEWDRVYSGADDGPQWDSAGSTPPDSISINAGDSAYVVSISATDPEGFDISYNVDISPSNQTKFTVTNNYDGTFDFLPDSAGTQNDGSITARFRAHDGLNYLSKSTTIELVTMPQKENLVAWYDFRNTSSWDGSSSTVYDLSDNNLDVTLNIGSGSYLNGTGVGGTTALQTATNTTMEWNFSQVGSVTSIVVIGTRPTDKTVVFNKFTQSYLGVWESGSSNDTHAGYDITGLEKVNGTDVNDNRGTAWNALSASLYNSWAVTGVTGPNSEGLTFNGYGSGFSSVYEVQAILFWSVDLTAAEIQRVHNSFSSMATYSA